MKHIESKAFRIKVLKDAITVIKSLDDELWDRLVDNTNARPETTREYLSDLIEGIEQEQAE
jgi:hypothetical protein